MPYDFARDKRHKVPLSSIVVQPNRARQDFSHIIEIKNSIEEVGLINPITVIPLPDNKYELQAGETRFRAYLLIPQAGGTIPITLDSDDRSPVERKVIELEENARRKNLEWPEQIQLMLQIDELRRKQLGDQTSTNPDGWSLKKTAAVVGLESAGDASRSVNFAKKLRSRPELMDRIKNLPLGPAMRVVEQIEESEKVERLHLAGEITLTNELVHLDAVTFLSSQPESSLDLILTDPPFGMEELESRRDQKTNTTQSYTGQLKVDDNSTRDEVLHLMSQVCPWVYRALKPGAHFYIFIEVELLGEIKTILESSKLVISWPLLLWSKERSTNTFKGYNYLSCYESIIFGYKPPEPKRLNKSMSSILSYPTLHSSKRLHPFEKPLDLLCDLIKNSTKLGDVVCDPFAGSGSTLVAAKQTGRKSLGCEINRENFLKAQSRLLLESTYGTVGTTGTTGTITSTSIPMPPPSIPTT